MNIEKVGKGLKTSLAKPFERTLYYLAPSSLPRPLDEVLSKKLTLSETPR